MLRLARIGFLSLQALAIGGCLQGGEDAVSSPYREAQSSSELRTALQSAERVNVIVALRQPKAPRTRLSERSLEIDTTRRRVLADAGSDVRETRSFRHVAGFAAEIGTTGLERLENHPDVVRVDLDVGGRGGLAESVPLINADSVHSSYGYDGAGVKVAILDTGFAKNHPDLAGLLIDEHCFCGPSCCPNGNSEQSGAGAAQDDHGHGSHVAGILASQGVQAPPGVAPGVSIVSVKVLDSTNSFNSMTQIVSALDWLLSNHPDVRAVNMSLGSTMHFSGTCDNSMSWTLTVADAIQTLRAQGALSFAASMNEGSAFSMPAPACVSSALAVGSVYDANLGSHTCAGCTDGSTMPDQVTCYSDSSPELDLLAPGSSITSVAHTGGTREDCGTSMATPHAVGLAALVFSAKPGLTDDAVEQVLRTTGTPVFDPRNGLTRPRVDAWAAITAINGAAGAGGGASSGTAGVGAGASSGAAGVGGGASSGAAGVGGADDFPPGDEPSASCACTCPAPAGGTSAHTAAFLLAAALWARRRRRQL